MACPSCGGKMESAWRFCPRCGYRKPQNFFDSIFSRFREMDTATGAAEREFESFDISDLMKRPAKGFTIRISTGTGMQPRIEVRASGADRKEIEKQMAGMWKGHGPAAPRQKSAEPALMMMPEKTEEPETSMKRVDGRAVIEMKLPDVEGKDVRVQEFESSVEVRAIGKGKAFFKIVTKPEKASVLRREFADGRLVLEIG